MDKNKDNGVSPVIATILLIALTIVLISLVSLAVMAGISSFVPAENKVVGFTVEVNATNNTALVTPVSGNDLPFMGSYRVYTNNGHWDSPDAGSITVTDFNSTVNYVNIVGNFSDDVTALVFSGKVVIEGGIVVVQPTGSIYYVVGEDGYDSIDDFVDSFNEWYHRYYPEAIGDAAVKDGNGIKFINDLPIIVGDEPITISNGNIGGIQNNFRILIEGGGNFTRAPGYESALFVINYSKVKVERGTLVLDGMGLPATHSALEIIGSSELSIENGGFLVVNNNINSNGDGGGIYSEGTITIAKGQSMTLTGNEANNGGGIYIEDAATLDVSGTLNATSNSANYGGGIYNKNTLNFNKDGILTVTGNTAYDGGGIYNTGILTTDKKAEVSITYNSATHFGGGVYNTGSFPSSGVTYLGNTASSYPDIYP